MTALSSRSLRKSGWVYLPLAFVFLLGISSTYKQAELPQSNDACGTLALSRIHVGLLRVISLSNFRLYEDYTYIWLINRIFSNSGSSCIQAGIDAMLKVKPKIEAIYLLSSMVMGFDQDNPQASSKILAVGLDIFPSSWRLAMANGYFYAFKLDQPLKAAYYFHLAYQLKPLPYIIYLTNQLLEKKHVDGHDEKKVLESLFEDPTNKNFQSFYREHR